MIGEVLKHIFFRIAKMLAVKRNVKPRNMNFAKVEGKGVGAINREGAFVWINAVFVFN